VPLDENDYLKLEFSDIPIIVEALNCDDDALRLQFGAKAFRKILTAEESPEMIVKVTKTFSR
jgi:hypothetical protein